MVNIDQLKHDYYNPIEILELLSNVEKISVDKEIFWVKNNIILVKQKENTLGFSYSYFNLHYYHLFFNIKNEYKLNYPETQSFFERFFKENFKINVYISPMRHDAITYYYQKYGHKIKKNKPIK